MVPSAGTTPAMRAMNPGLLVLLALILSPSHHLASQTRSPIQGAYWTSWSSTDFPVSAINTTLFTHIYYAFLNADPASYRLVISNSDDSLLSSFATTLHSRSPPTKALISIAGNNSVLAPMAANYTSRKAFIESSIAAARDHGCDGLDIDWEYPSTQKEMSDFALLLEEWRAAIVSEARDTGRPQLLLTAAVYFAAEFFLSNGSEYPVESIKANLDWIHVMCYDYHGSWDTSATGTLAALYDPTSNISTSYGLGSWVAAGVPPEMMVMGLPLYGRTWTLKDPAEHGIGAPAVGLGPGEGGEMTYAEVVDFNAANGGVEVYDETTVSAYCYAGTAWIGYDDALSAAKKVEYARDLGLAGYFFWAVGGDNDWEISQQASVAWKT